MCTALCIEKLGLTSFSWVMYAVIEKLACVKLTHKIISEKNDSKGDAFVPSKNIIFSVITEKEADIEDEFRSASTTGTVVNPYIIKTPTYSV